MAATSASLSRAPGPTRPISQTAPRTRLWLDFVNTDTAPLLSRGEQLRDFAALLRWLVDHDIVDRERAEGLSRRALLQPAAAAATLLEARRVRASLRALAEYGTTSRSAREQAVLEINRVLGRSTGTRRLDSRGDGGFVRVFVPTGDAFAGLLIPIVESTADALAVDELARVRACAERRCGRVFLDTSRNGTRRWCDMGTCGNRAKAARHRARVRTSSAAANLDD